MFELMTIFCNIFFYNYHLVNCQLFLPLCTFLKVSLHLSYNYVQRFVFIAVLWRLSHYSLDFQFFSIIITYVLFSFLWLLSFLLLLDIYLVYRLPLFFNMINQILLIIIKIEKKPLLVFQTSIYDFTFQNVHIFQMMFYFLTTQKILQVIYP